ncbi:hypothetical protein LOD99_1061 [Oopsacas minuta]|uniref:Pre-rRNA-processing protein RIX1 n=1 Tax=Oopsacas minuta TaxID=111878 RepID=A0AAV7K0E9_9METZ|nr:hypothetical protein LOD99_1061 [Oopsacas minuta]
MESEELHLKSSLSSLQNLSKLLVEGHCINSTELVSITDTLPEIVRIISNSGSSRDASLLAKIGSNLSTILSTETLATVRVHALQCLLACIKYSKEIVSADKTKRRVSNFAREHLDHNLEYIRICCISWLSYCPTLSKPGPEGEKFCYEWRQVMNYTLSSLQGCITSLSSVSVSSILSIESPLPLPALLDTSHTCRRIDSLFNLILSLLSQSSPYLVSIPIEAILYITTLTISHLVTNQHTQVICSAWVFLEKLCTVIPSCIIPLTQPISVLFVKSMNNSCNHSVSMCMLQCLSSWLEVSQTSVLPFHLHQFIGFLKTNSSLRLADNSPILRQKRSRDTNEIEFNTDRDKLMLANQCLSASVSLVRNCIVEVSVSEYNEFMSHLVCLIPDTSLLQVVYPPDPLITMYTVLLYSFLSDSILYSHPMTSSYIPTLLPYFTEGMYSDHMSIRKVCRTAISLIESMVHPSFPPIKPSVPSHNPDTCLYPQLLGSSPPPPPLQSPHIYYTNSTDNNITIQQQDNTEDGCIYTQSVDQEEMLDLQRADESLEDPIHSILTPTEYPVEVDEERPTKLPRLETVGSNINTPANIAVDKERRDELSGLDMIGNTYNKDLSNILSTFVEAEPDPII